jgi:hypothetical protein
MLIMRTLSSMQPLLTEHSLSHSQATLIKFSHNNLNIPSGGHIFVRSGLTLQDVNWVSLGIVGVIAGVVVALYASFLRKDFSLVPLAKRSLVASLLCFGPVLVGTCFWATVYYPGDHIKFFRIFTLISVTTMHVAGMVTFVLAAVSSDFFYELLS